MSIKVKQGNATTSNFKVVGIEKSEISDKTYTRVILESPDFRPVKMTVKKLENMFSDETVKAVKALLADKKGLQDIEESLSVGESVSIEVG
jgi:hypothetical protein